MDLSGQGIWCQGDRDTSADFSVHGIPNKGNTANNVENETKQFLLVRYETQALDLVSEHNVARETTEKDSW